MALRNRITAFLFGFALQITLVAMSFVGFLAPSTTFENLVQRFADLAGWIILIGVTSAVVAISVIPRYQARRAGRVASMRVWLMAFLLGFMLGMASTAMGLAGGFWGPSTTWQNVSRHIAEVLVLTLAYAGAAFALYDVVRLWRVPPQEGRKKSCRISARAMLAVVLLQYALGTLLGPWASGAVFAATVFLTICSGAVLDLSSS